MKKMHITPQGVLPCTAGKRPCRYKFHGTNMEVLQEKMDEVFSLVLMLPKEKRETVLHKKLEYTKTEVATTAIQKEIQKLIPEYKEPIVLNEDRKILADVTNISPLYGLTADELEQKKKTKHGLAPREAYRQKEIAKRRTGKEVVDCVVLVQDGYSEQSNPSFLVKQLVYLTNGERFIFSTDSNTLITSSVFTTPTDLSLAYGFSGREPNEDQKKVYKINRQIQNDWRELTKNKKHDKIRSEKEREEKHGYEHHKR